MIDVKETFAKFENEEFLKFNQVVNKMSQRADINAFLLLDWLMPSDGDIIAAAEHDIIYLDANINKLAEIATEENIVELIRCGVMYDNETDSLMMYA